VRKHAIALFFLLLLKKGVIINLFFFLLPPPAMPRPKGSFIKFPDEVGKKISAVCEGGSTFQNYVELKDLVYATVLSNTLLICPLPSCRGRLYSRADAISHLNSVHLKFPVCYCPLCPGYPTFSSRRYFKIHYSRNHPKRWCPLDTRLDMPCTPPKTPANLPPVKLPPSKENPRWHYTPATAPAPKRKYERKIPAATAPATPPEEETSDDEGFNNDVERSAAAAAAANLEDPGIPTFSEGITVPFDLPAPVVSTGEIWWNL
jgi:hypothetical protein